MTVDGPTPPPSVVDAVRAATRITVLTGAGMSAESGLPTFRDTEDGLWARYDPMTLAPPEAWHDDPALVWGWYQQRRIQLDSAAPNPAHLALADLAARRDVQIVTQNVDELHEQAGSTEVIHIHGTLSRSYCDTCGDNYTIPTAMPRTERVPPPTCGCGGLVRPGVVWFGEMLPEVDFARAIGAVQESDVRLIVGTSGMVQPAAGLPQLARMRGSFIVEVNPETTELSDRADVTWRASAGAALPALVAATVDTR